MHLLDAERLLVVLQVEWSLGHEGAFLVADDQHVVVEAGDGDVSVLVVQRGYHLAEYVDGVGHGAAIDAAVQVVVGTGDLHFPIAEAAQAAGDAGGVLCYHACVADQDDVGAQQLLVLLAEAVEAATAYLLLALEHEFDVAGQLAGLDHELESLGLHEALAFVVVGSAGPNLVVLDDGLEGFGVPQVEGLDGHHVVVAIDQHGGFGGVYLFLAVYHGVAVGGHHLGVVAARGEQQLTPAVGAAHHVVLVLALGTDGGNANEAEKLLKKTVFVFVDVFFYVFHFGVNCDW